MNSPDENIDPHSLPNPSRLVSNSAHQRNNKPKLHKGFPPVSGLRESTLPNISTERMHTPVDLIDVPLPTPPNSQSTDSAHDNVIDGPRLPISPPPEEEIRVKELSAQPKQKAQSRLPVPARGAPSTSFKFPVAPQSFAEYQQKEQRPRDRSPNVVVSTTNAPPASTNPRKRGRSDIPPPAIPASTSSTPSSSRFHSKPAVVPTTQSPNPKPRKQVKVRDSGPYAGSGFKRRHTRGASAESINANDANDDRPPAATPQKSPARKKRTKDPGIEDYTPQRSQASLHRGSSTKKRSRKSTTPDVPYEPPSEQFTPPRHVVLQPPSSTVSTRSRKPRQSSAQLTASVERKVVRVKLEALKSPFPLPPIDLSKPTAPPSPTDDPILLIGSPFPPQHTKTLVSTTAGDDHVHKLDKPTAPLHTSPRRVGDESTWHMAPDTAEETALMDVGFDGPSHFDATFDPASDSDSNNEASFSSVAFHGHSPRLDPNKSTGSHIFHSDDEEAEDAAGEDEGEFTGRFKFYSVPVKQDPPSSATRLRRESWGRPISPFPFPRRTSGSQVEQADANDDRTHEQSDNESPPPSPSAGRRRSPTHSDSDGQIRRTGGFTLSEMEARLAARSADLQGLTGQQEQGGGAIPETESAVRQGKTAEEIKLVRSDGTLCIDEDDTDENAEADESDAESVEREVTPVNEDTNADSAQDEGELSEDEPKRVWPDMKESFRHIPGDDVEHQNDDEEVSNRDGEEETHDARAITLLPQNSATRINTSLLSGQYIEGHNPHHNDDNGVVSVDTYDNDDSSDEESVPTGVVEISSDDPMAAARAAAILKLHHAYLVDGSVPQRMRRSSAFAFSRRRSFAFGDGSTLDDTEHQDMIRRAGRKSLAQSGGVSQHRPRRDSPLMRAMSVPPGSPAGSVISAEDALREAETEIRAASASPLTPKTPPRLQQFDVGESQSGLVTPSPANTHSPTAERVPPSANQREWTKSDWKRLDTCFTDERVSLAQMMGLDVQMAEVDEVEIDAVVDRFLATVPETWDRDILFRRAKALLNRQRAGQGAPPSPINTRSTRGFVSPVSTPPVPQRPLVPLSHTSTLPKIPPSLLAPRYSHLHQEVVVNCVEQPSSASATVKEFDAETTKRSENFSLPARQPVVTPSRPQTGHTTHIRNEGDTGTVPPASATKRVLSYLGSFLGRGASAKTTRTALRPTFNALPLPPPEMLQTTRGPVNTPAKKPIPRTRAPRELVHLTEAQLPPRPPTPPRTKSAREMVTLNHVEPPRSVQRPRSMPIAIPGRTRKDSGGSVKDLVRSFEEVQKKSEAQIARSSGSRGAVTMRKVASVGDLKNRAPWKP